MKKRGVITALMLLVSSATVADAAGQQSDPKPLVDLAAVFGPDNYPASAILVEEEGTVVAALTIDPSGAVTACKIIASSGSTALDSATCQIMNGRKAAFAPARDVNGRAVTGNYNLTVRWALPEAQPSPLESSGSYLTMRLSKTAVIQSCIVRNMPGDIVTKDDGLCAMIRDGVKNMIVEHSAQSPVEVVMMMDRMTGQGEPLSGSVPDGMTIVDDVTAEYLIQPGGLRTDCKLVVSFVNSTIDGEDLCVRKEKFVKHDCAPMAVRDQLRVAYRYVDK